MHMFGDDAVGILNRHRIAGERHHPRPEFDVQSMQGRLFQSSRVGHCLGFRHAAPARETPNIRTDVRLAPPLSRDLRDFLPDPRARSYPRRWACIIATATFQSVIPPAV